MSYLLGNNSAAINSAGAAATAEPAEASEDATDEGASAIQDAADDAARQRKHAAQIETATTAVTATEAEQASVTGRATNVAWGAIRATVRQAGAIGALTWLGLDGRVADLHLVWGDCAARITATVTEDERMASIGDHTKSKNHNKTKNYPFHAHQFLLSKSFPATRGFSPQTITGQEEYNRSLRELQPYSSSGKETSPAEVGSGYTPTSRPSMYTIPHRGCLPLDYRKVFHELNLFCLLRDDFSPTTPNDENPMKHCEKSIKEALIVGIPLQAGLVPLPIQGRIRALTTQKIPKTPTIETK